MGGLVVMSGGVKVREVSLLFWKSLMVRTTTQARLIHESPKHAV